MILTAAERVVMNLALDGTGFVSERELNRSQILVARRLAQLGHFKRAGAEPDGTAVYQVTARGRAAFE